MASNIITPVYKDMYIVHSVDIRCLTLTTCVLAPSVSQPASLVMDPVARILSPVPSTGSCCMLQRRWALLLSASLRWFETEKMGLVNILEFWSAVDFCHFPKCTIYVNFLSPDTSQPRIEGDNLSVKGMRRLWSSPSTFLGWLPFIQKKR